MNSEKEFDEKIKEAFDLYLKREAEKVNYKDIKETVTFSDRYKKKSNRMFRERMGIDKIPYPEVDNIFEKCRSKIIRKILLLIKKS